MAVWKDTRGMNVVHSTYIPRILMDAAVPQITLEYASDDMLPRIDIAEFSHSWGQNTIVNGGFI